METYHKTITLISREDRKMRQFWEVYGGYGTETATQRGKCSNLFKGDQRISILGLFQNINQPKFLKQDLAGVSVMASAVVVAEGERGGKQLLSRAEIHWYYSTNAIGSKLQ